MRKALLALLFCLVAVPASAQVASQPTVAVGAAFKVAATHDGANTSGYRLKADGKAGADVPLASLVAGTVTIDAPAFSARGAHTVQLCAFNADAESCSDVAAVTAVLPPPAKPTNLRVIVAVTTSADGQLRFEVLGVDSAPLLAQ